MMEALQSLWLFHKPAGAADYDSHAEHVPVLP